MPLARRDEIEIQRAVRAESARVGVPVEAAGRFGVAGGLELGHAWKRGGELIDTMEIGGRICARTKRNETSLTVIEHDLLQDFQRELIGCCGCWRPSFYVIVDLSAVAGKLVEILKACEFREHVEVDVFRRVSSGWMS